MQDIIFNTCKVRYSLLDELFSTNSDIKPTDSVNLFINLDYVFRKLSSKDMENYFRLDERKHTLKLVSNIFNLAAHYRLFFKKNKLKSNIYLYTQYPFDIRAHKNKVFIPEYKDTHRFLFEKDTNKYIFNRSLVEAIRFAQMLLECVEGVHIIQSGYLESSLVPYMISNTSVEQRVNILVSNDKYEYQYVNKDYYIIKPNGDKSTIINKHNLMSLLDCEDIDSCFYTFIYSVLGDKYRNIEKIKKMGIKTVSKLIQKAIDEKLIYENSTSINIMSKLVNEKYKDMLIKNFYVTDIDSQFSRLNKADFHLIGKQIKDKFDNVSLKEINETTFINCPLMMIEIQNYNKEIKKSIFQ